MILLVLVNITIDEDLIPGSKWPIIRVALEVQNISKVIYILKS